MYFIQGFSFTFDDVSEDEENNLTALNIGTITKFSHIKTYIKVWIFSNGRGTSMSLR